MARGIDGISGELHAQRDFLAASEPAYARLLDMLDEAARGEFGARLAQTWAERDFSWRYERPLLLLAALRYDALHEGAAHPLHPAVAQTPALADAVTAEALAAAVAPARLRFWNALPTRAIQTNETTRAVAWLWPAHLLARCGERRGLALCDLGASAGLNLIADELPPLWIDQHGAAIAVAPRPPVRLRLGFDRAPLDVRDDDAATWLRACVWPSDGERLARLDQGIACLRARTGEDAPRLIACDLADVPTRLDELPADLVLLCVQSIVAAYLTAEERARYERGMHELLLRRPPRSALWCELELVRGRSAPEEAAALTVRFVDADNALRELVLARTHPHPKRLVCDAAAASALEAAFTGSA